MKLKPRRIDGDSDGKETSGGGGLETRKGIEIGIEEEEGQGMRRVRWPFL